MAKYRVVNTTYSRPEAGVRVTYQPGDVIENLSESALRNLGDNFKLIEENKEIDWEEEVKQYHKGGGYYDIPGIDETVKGKEDAIEYLKLTEGEE